MLSAPTRIAPARLQARDERRVGRGGRQVAVDLRTGARRQAGNVEQVLDRERHAGERTERLASGAGRVDRIGLGERPRRRHIGEGAERAVVRFDARQRRFARLRARLSAPSFTAPAISAAVMFSVANVMA